jgi:hypothetical protein
MKATKRNEGTANKPVRKFYGFDYEVMPQDDSEGAPPKERFDKKYLSEDDLDKIRAIT